MSITYLCGSQVGIRQYLIDERWLPHSTIATQQRHLTMQHGNQLVYALSCNGRDGNALIADGIVKRHHHLLNMQFLFIQQITLVEHQYHGYSIRLGRSQEAVDKRSGSLGIIHRYHQECLIDIGGNDMALLGEIRWLTDNIITAFINGSDESRALCVHRNIDMVTHSNGIGAADAF